MYRGIQISYSSDSIGVVELFLVFWDIIRNPRVFTESVLDIRKSNAMTHKIISINCLRIAVTFLQGTFHPKHSTAICFEVSMFDISVELSQFRGQVNVLVELWANQIAGSGCGPDWP